MNFDWSEADNDFKQRVCALFHPEALGELEGLEKADTANVRRITKRFMKDLAPTGYLRPTGKDQILRLPAGQEEVARISSSLFMSIEVTARIFGGLLAQWPESPIVSEIVKAVGNGEVVGAVALTEPALATEDGPVSKIAAWDGDHCILNGKKDFVTNAPIADWIAVVLDEDSGKTVCLIRPDRKGLVMGPRLATLGYNGLAVSSLEFAGLDIHKDFVFGPLDDTAIAEHLYQTQDMTLAMASVGIMHATIIKAKQYAQSHRREGKPIFAHQEIRFKLAEMLTLYQSSQLLVFRAGWMISSNNPEASVMVKCAKVFASEASEKVAAMGMQILSGQGYVMGNFIERAFRDSKYAALAGTTSERARMQIADELLAQYG
jgi:alkylation response protein AidB-like acyl-CoA dehydrogenase